MYMEPKKARSKTVIFVVVIAILVAGLVSYYIAAIRSADNTQVQTDRTR